MNQSYRSRYLLVITILMYVAFGLVTSVIGVIIDKFQSEYNFLFKLRPSFLLPSIYHTVSFLSRLVSR